MLVTNQQQLNNSWNLKTKEGQIEKHDNLQPYKNYIINTFKPKQY